MPVRTASGRGHTIPELLAMLGIAAILAVVAVPVFSNLLLESRMNAAVATAMHAVNLARQFSATRSETIRLCGSNDAQGCSGQSDWSTGLLLADSDVEPGADGIGPFRRSVPLPGGSGAPEVRSNRATLEFEGGSGFATPATLTVCDRRRTRAARAIIVSRSGRPRTSDRDASDKAIAC
jgi:type IV fimbrial biogenesis protein FimT